jgi:hypothetical protein
MQAASDILSPKHPADAIRFMGFFIGTIVTTVALDLGERRHLHGVWRCFLSPKEGETVQYYVSPKEARSSHLKVELSDLEKSYFCALSCKNTTYTKSIRRQ